MRYVEGYRNLVGLQEKAEREFIPCPFQLEAARPIRVCGLHFIRQKGTDKDEFSILFR